MARTACGGAEAEVAVSAINKMSFLVGGTAETVV
jgi:hypothetical protein